MWFQAFTIHDPSFLMEIFNSADTEESRTDA